jgi:hypothetical protein
MMEVEICAMKLKEMNKLLIRQFKGAQFLAVSTNKVKANNKFKVKVNNNVKWTKAMVKVKIFSRLRLTVNKGQGQD